MIEPKQFLIIIFLALIMMLMDSLSFKWMEFRFERKYFRRMNLACRYFMNRYAGTAFDLYNEDVSEFSEIADALEKDASFSKDPDA